MASKPKIFVYPGDSYIGRAVGQTFEARGYEVLTACTGTETPSFSSTSYSIGGEDAKQTEKQFLQVADVVVVELFGHEQAARSLAIEMAKQPFGGRQQALIAVSDPLVWATTTPPPPPEPEPWPERPYSSSSQRSTSQALTATSGAVTHATSPFTSAAATPPPLSDVDVPRRCPCLAANDTLDAETTVLRAARRNRLRTHVVCPGLLYGRGESDAFLLPCFKQCWSVDQGAPKIYGPGTNQLPMVHVADMAQYVAEVAACTALTQQYLLVLDEGQATQGEVVRAVSGALGTGAVDVVPREQLSLLPGLDRHLLDLRFSAGASPLPAGCSYTPAFASGFLANVDAVVEEYRSYRGVSPMRVVLMGPPMAGKSSLGVRLAKQYGLTYVSAKELLEAVKDAEPELQKAVAAELSGKEPRVSSKNMAALLRCMLAGQKIRNRGYVLDAFPRTVASARFAFLKAVPMSEAEAAEAARQRERDDAAARAATPTKGGKGGGKDAAPAKGGKGGGKSTPTPTSPSDGPEVPSGHKLVPDPAYAPSHVIQLDADEATLRARLKAIEAAEYEAARAAVAAAGPPPKGAKEKPIVVGGHNNEAGFARRMEAWAKARADDAEDLAARVAAAEARWAALQAEKEEERRKAEAEANTLKARRRRARAEAIAAASGAGAGGEAQQGAEAATAASEALLASSAPEDGSLDATAAADATTAAPVSEAGPVLPEYGGLVGVLVGECGARFTVLPNESAEPDGAAVLLPHDGKPVVLPASEAAVQGFLGPARNFDGLVADDPDAAPELRGESSEQRRTREGAERETAARAALATRREREQAQARQAQLQAAAFLSAPLQKWLLSELMPVVTEGLVTIVRDRPSDPIGTLADRLVQEAERLEAAYVDPYTDPIYEVQAAKIKAKEERDAARAAAASAKAEREMATKLAARDEERKKRATEEGEAAAPSA